jgi:hypothetical protein
MRAQRASLLLAVAALPVLAGPVPADRPALAPAPAAAIEACVAGLDPLDIGYERIAARCPGLTAALEGSPYAAWLPGDWVRPGNELSAAGLAQLQRLLVQELAPRQGAHVPDVAHLAAVLAQLPPSGQPPVWRTRLSGWLRGGAAQPAGAGVPASLRSAAGLPAWAVYALLGAGVLLAATLAGRELRLAGLRFPRLRFSGLHKGSKPAAAAPAAESVLKDESPGEPRLGVLLSAVAARLAEQGRLPPAGGLTARELVRDARLPAERLADLQALTRAAEAQRYAPVPLADAELAEAARHGRRLLDALAASP